MSLTISEFEKRRAVILPMMQPRKRERWEVEFLSAQRKQYAVPRKWTE